MADPNLAGVWRRSRRSIRPDRYWIVTLDGTRLREARIERGLSRDELAADAGVSLATVGWLEGRGAASCHRGTLYRIAEVLADDPDRIVAALVIEDGAAEARGPQMPSLGPPSSWLCTRTFAARPEQVAQARAFLGRVLHGCPLEFEAQVICSELVTNAILHSRSGMPGGQVIVRTHVRERDYIWLEVEDQGGEWARRGHRGDGGRGLEVVAALSDYWDIKGDEARRTICARLDWPAPQWCDGGRRDFVWASDLDMRGLNLEATERANAEASTLDERQHGNRPHQRQVRI